MLNFEIGLHEVLNSGEIHFVLINDGWFRNGVPIVRLIVVPQNLFEQFNRMASLFIMRVVNVDCQRSFLNWVLDNSFFIYFLIVNSICRNRENLAVTDVRFG